MTLIALAIWIYLRHRKPRTTDQEPYRDPKAELPGRGAEKRRQDPAELNAVKEASEMTGHGKPAELDTGGRYELEGGWHGHEAQE